MAPQCGAKHHSTYRIYAEEHHKEQEGVGDWGEGRRDGLWNADVMLCYAFLIVPQDRKHRQTYPQNPPHVFELVEDANHTQNAQQA